MRFSVISDLHLTRDDSNFFIDLLEQIREQDPDVIINAGDICTTHSQDIFDYVTGSLDKIAPTVTVLGNHDYYRAPFRPAREHQDKSIIGGWFIHGSPLWTDFFSDPIEEAYAARGMNDFNFIQDWNTFEWKNLHYDLRNDIFEALNGYVGSGYKHAVVTHHSPSKQSIGEHFRSSKINGAFVNDMDHIIEKFPQVKLWVHGHVHDSVDAMIGDHCRLVANPRGYRGERNYWNYRPKVVDIE